MLKLKIVPLMLCFVSLAHAQLNPLSLNTSMDILELDHFRSPQPHHQQQINIIIEELQTIINPEDPPTSVHHILLARALYLRSLITQQSYSITDIFQAILIEEALIPSYRGIDFSTNITPSDRQVIKTLLYSFYKTQARYSFFIEHQSAQALSALNFALIFTANPLFTLYEAAFILKQTPQILTEEDPINSLQQLLNQTTTSVLQRAIIYLLLAALLPNTRQEYLIYAKSALQAAQNLGEDINQVAIFLAETLPTPLLILPAQLLNDLLLEIADPNLS